MKFAGVVGLAIWLSVMAVGGAGSGSNPLCRGERATIVGTGKADRLKGTPRNDVIVAGAGRDVVRALEGNDIVCGGGGADVIAGSVGEDLLQGDRGKDLLSGGRDKDLLIGGLERDRLVGGQSDDTLHGEDGDDFLDGGNGADVVSFTSAKSGVVVDLAAMTASGQGNDELTGIEGVEGSEFDDAISGSDRGNELLGGGGADRLLGSRGLDSLDGGDGDDFLDGGNGADVVSFTSAKSGVVVDLAAMTASGQGNDELTGIEELQGSEWDDVLKGTDGADRISGGPGFDILRGRSGDDSLTDGFHEDRLDGGSGADRCFLPAKSVGSCETVSHYDGGPTSQILDPRNGAQKEPGKVRRLAGKAWTGTFFELDEVRVALRKKGDTGCRWWSNQRRRFVPRACSDALWMRAQGRRHWDYRLDRPLPNGRFAVWSRALAEKNIKENSNTGRNRTTFVVK